jgi:hypothetical protein
MDVPKEKEYVGLCGRNRHWSEKTRVRFMENLARGLHAVTILRMGFV